MQPGETKQVWVTVRVPSGAPPGTYTGAISAVSENTSYELPLELEVLPLRLREATQDALLWYKGTLDCTAPQHYVPPHIFEAQLRDIFAHGFRSISLTETRPDTLRRALALARKAGFARNVVLVEPYVEGMQADDFASLTPLYYLSDELDARGQAAVSHHIANWKAAKGVGGRTMISLLNSATARRFDLAGDIGHSPDIFSFYLPMNRSYFAGGAGRESYYYWLSHMEKPVTHRVLAGLYLWRSGAAGIAPYCYQHRPRYPNSPFDDFDEWEPEAQGTGDGRLFKDHMTTYPARGGTIPTLQWKGLSDGLTDLRYLTTVDALIEAASRSDSEHVRRQASDVRARMHRFLDRLSLNSIEIVSETDPLPYAEIAPSAYSDFREQMARDAVLLQRLLSAEPAHAAV